MATLGGDVTTLWDIANLTGGDGMIAEAVNTLTQSHAMLDDFHMQAGNLPTGNRTVQVTGLPTIYKRKLNSGVVSSKPTFAPIQDVMTLYEAHYTTDEETLRLAPDPGAARAQNLRPFWESMAQAISEGILYNNPADDPDDFTGLLPRYNTLSGIVADNVLDSNGSAGGLSSVWLVQTGPGKVYLSHPKNVPGGIEHWSSDKMPIQDTDSTGIGQSTLVGYFDQFKMTCGLVVEDWRCIVRIANINTTELGTISGDQAITAPTYALPYLMSEAIDRLPSVDGGRNAFYCSRKVMSLFRKWGLYASVQNMFETRTLENGGAETTFSGIPIRVVDQILNTETEVTT